MLYPSVVHRTRSTQHLEDTRVHREKHHPSISQARHAFTSQGPRVLSPSVKICCLRLQDPSTTSSPSTTMDDQEASPPPESVQSRSNSAVDTTSPIEKRVLRIVPRTKTVQSRRVKRTVQSVEVTVDTIRNLSSYSEVAAAASLGISVTALKHACRTLGFEKWPRQSTDNFDVDASKDKGKSNSRTSSKSSGSVFGKNEDFSASAAKPAKESAKAKSSSGPTLELAGTNTAFEDSRDSGAALSEPFDLNDSMTPASTAPSRTAAPYYADASSGRAFASSLAKSHLWNSDKYEPNPAFHGCDRPAVGLSGTAWAHAQAQEPASKPCVGASSATPAPANASTFSFPSHFAWHTAAAPDSTQFGFPAPASALHEPSQLASHTANQQPAGRSLSEPMQIAVPVVSAAHEVLHSVTSAFIEPMSENNSMFKYSAATTAPEDYEMMDDWSPPKLSVDDAATLYHSLGGESWFGDAAAIESRGESDLERHIFLSARLAREQRLWNLHEDDCH